MFSLFISFDIVISSLNQFLMIFFVCFCFYYIFNNFFFFSSSYILAMTKSLYKEVFILTKMKTNFSLMLLLSSFFMLLDLNLLGLIPFFFTLSTQLNFCFFLSLFFWLAITMMNFSKEYKNFFPHLVPSGSPLILSQFMVMVETISQLIRPITLGVRLMANMTAGHLMLNLCSSIFFLFNFASLPLSFLMFLEIMVAIIQAYVFMILLSMYMGEFNQ